MDPLSLVIAFVLGSIIAFVVATLLNKTKTVPKEEHNSLNASFNNVRNELSVAQTQEKALTEKIGELSSENGLLESQLIGLREEKQALRIDNATMKSSLANQQEEIETVRKQFTTEFENLANSILESKSKRFTLTNKENIESIIKPLNEEIAAFKLKVDETYDKESKERFSLEKRVAELILQTDKVSAEANNLASALKGQAKVRGDWGEVILERVLEASGLTRGREYKVQESIRNESGELVRPDVTVYLPDERNVIIDSKISLIAYERFCSTESDDERKGLLVEHLRSVYLHIDQLHAKKYDEITSSLDFTLMFVPIEPAYHLAMQNDNQLWDRAYKKHVILVSPTNLIAVIKLVSDIWNRDRQSKNVLEIARRGQRLYDKFIGFLDTLKDVGEHIEKAQRSYDAATNQLKQGKGNLVWQAEQLKSLGVEPKKGLTAAWANYDDTFEEDDDLAELPLLDQGKEEEI